MKQSIYLNIKNGIIKVSGSYVVLVFIYHEYGKKIKHKITKHFSAHGPLINDFFMFSLVIEEAFYLFIHYLFYYLYYTFIEK